LEQEDLIELQQEYVDTFDRGRACALHLFEHVHGDSRDRGQAMVDLVDVYREAGYTIAVAELSDYLPLFLEFLSTRLAADASSWLAQVEHIIKLLYVRLQDRGSRYAVLFSPLLSIAGVVIRPEERQALLGERDDTPEALDAAWAEEPVTFGLGAEACPSSKPQHSAFPVRWPERPKA
jgi:nitrate reductase delta subunit